MRPPLSGLLLTPLLLTPLLLVGCSSGSSPTPPVATAAADRAAYVQAAEAVCARSVAQGRVIAQPSSAAELVPSYERIIAVGRRGLAGLTALTPPAADAAELQRALLGPAAQQLEGLQRTLPDVRAAAASTDPVAAFATIPDPVKAVGADLDWLRRYGMPSCAAFVGS